MELKTKQKIVRPYTHMPKITPVSKRDSHIKFNMYVQLIH